MRQSCAHLWRRCERQTRERETCRFELYERLQVATTVQDARSGLIQTLFQIEGLRRTTRYAFIPKLSQAFNLAAIEIVVQRHS